MPLKTIRIVVQDDGTCQTDFSNFTGTDCLVAGKQMHKLLAQFGVQLDQSGFSPKPELLAAQGMQEIPVSLETNEAEG